MLASYSYVKFSHHHNLFQCLLPIKVKAMVNNLLDTQSLNELNMIAQFVDIIITALVLSLKVKLSMGKGTIPFSWMTLYVMVVNLIWDSVSMNPGETLTVATWRM